ncbi:MAG: hypothetical protein QOE65_546 [Solirubrobacteraceae bacterium]|nr:hypothetical protein [Solirubrobacteraceae bacterium]
MADATVRVKPAQQHTVIDSFPQAGHRALFDRGDVRIETLEGALIGSRRNARAAFAGISGLRRNVRWDRSTPVSDGAASRSARIHTHSPRQTFYVDVAALIRRHDYTAQPASRWAHAAHYPSDGQPSTDSSSPLAGESTHAHPAADHSAT